MAERMIQAGEVELCVETFGDPAGPAVLLIAGLGSSMCWWDDEVCRRLAGAGRFVIRYDHRDTGRSQAFAPGEPGYAGDALVADAAGVLDALGVAAAHVVGVSAGGALAQSLALAHPERVRSLTLVSTSPATEVDRPLPPPTDDFRRFAADARVDWSDEAAVVDHLVAYARVLAGGARPFDEDAVRAFVRRDVARTRDVASLQNHDLVAGDAAPAGSISSIAAPTLVIHGTDDPLFPLAHGEALAAELPRSTLLVLVGAGHGLDPADHDTIVAAIIAHTA